jgi:hypothetical protein
MLYKNRNKKSKHLHPKHVVIISAGLLVLVAGSILYFTKANNNHAGYVAGPASNQQNINLNPPTEEEKKAGDEAKPQIVNEETNRNNGQSGSSKKVVMPVISYAGLYGNQVEVGAGVSGVFEDGGICTLTLQKDGVKQTASVTAVKGANSVDCPVMTVQRSSLSAGNWQAVVDYSSQAAKGTSSQRAVEVK